jgi:asparagine synthase (glutamine-hydrolysing)
MERSIPPAGSTLIAYFFMPGIAGIIGTFEPATRRELCRAMQAKITHEPFYVDGSFSDDSLGLSIAWCGLPESCRDPMPVWNTDRTIGLIFFGEEFSGSEVAVQLRTRGYWCPAEDFGFLLHFYEEVGRNCLRQANGGFCGVLVDRRKRSVLLFNDRYGLGRLYYHEDEQGIYFSSEAKCLLKVLPACRAFNPVGLAEFYSCGCALQNRTLFAGISLLPCASAWTYSPDRAVERTLYFRPEEWESQPQLLEDEYDKQLRETWSRILPRYFRGSVALSLTGGVDSRMILAWAPCLPGTLPCYTFGGMYRDCADVKVARAVASICRQKHQILAVGDEFLAAFPALAEKTVYISDGAMDVTGAIDLYIQRLARPIAPVRITGTNGGEILRRLVAFKPTSHRIPLLEPSLAALAGRAGDTYHQELRGHRLSFTAFKQAPWYMCSKFAVERTQLTLRMPYFDNDLVQLSYRAPSATAESNGAALRLIASGNPALGTISTDRGLGFGAGAGLTQARHLLQQFTFKAEYAYDYGMPQWLARVDHALAPLHLDRLFLGRHKFHHFRTYYRDHFGKYVREILLDARTRGRSYLQGDRLEPIVKGHLAGYRNHTLELHAILTSELIHRQLIESN